MKTRRTAILFLLSVVTAACTTAGSGSETTTAATEGESDRCPTEGEEFETAMLYIEHNATDQDTGVHGNFGGEAWTSLCIRDPEGQFVLIAQPQGSMESLGMADLLFESREPPHDEVSVDEILSGFPEGEYLVGATGQDGVARVGTAIFSHVIPAEPIITAPELADEEETANEAVVDPSGLVVTWEPVTDTLDGDAVDITGYQVIITKVEHDDPNGFSRPVYDVHLGPDATALPVPQEFLESGTLYELEVLALEVSGNQTIGLGFFTTK